MNTPDPIAIFDAEIIRVKTMADGSPRFELGSGEEANELLSVFARAQAEHRLVKVIVYNYSDWQEMERE